MKMRHLVVATSAALISFGALAAGEQSQPGSETTAPQAASDTATVREALQRLRDAGYATTPEGLKEFQQAQGIEPSGRLDRQTLAALGVDASAASGASSERAPQPAERPKY